MSNPHPNTKRVWLIAALAAAALYIGTAAPSLLWGDSGDAQLRVLLGQFFDRRFLSRSHVLFYLLAHVLTGVGLTPAYAATLLSALAGAVTVANVAALVTMLTKHRMPVLCATALLLFSHCLWHIATVAEVMTLSTALLSLELLLITRFIQTRAATWFVAAALVNGLGFSAHNFALLIWPAYAVLLLHLRVRHSIPAPRAVVAAVAAWLAGAIPLLTLFLHLARQSGQPLDIASRMLTGGYVPNVFNTHVSLVMIATTLAYTAYSFPTPLVLVAVPGTVALWRRHDRSPALFLFAAFAVYFVFAARYDVPDRHVFMLHSYLFATVFVAIGLDALCARVRPPTHLIFVLLAGVAPAVYAVVPDFLRDRFPDIHIVPTRHVPHRDPYTWFLKPWRAGDTGPERLARETFDALPENAVLSVDSTLMPPFLYLQNAEKLRRDVRILAAGPFQPWFRERLDIASPLRDRLVRDGRLFTPTNVRRSWNNYLRASRYDVIPHGHAFKFILVPKNRPTPSTTD